MYAIFSRIFVCTYNLPERSASTAVVSVTMNTRPSACKYLGNDILSRMGSLRNLSKIDESLKELDAIYNF